MTAQTRKHNSERPTKGQRALRTMLGRGAWSRSRPAATQADAHGAQRSLQVVVNSWAVGRSI